MHDNSTHISNEVENIDREALSSARLNVRIPLQLDYAICKFRLEHEGFTVTDVILAALDDFLVQKNITKKNILPQLKARMETINQTNSSLAKGDHAGVNTGNTKAFGNIHAEQGATISISMSDEQKPKRKPGRPRKQW